MKQIALTVMDDQKANSLVDILAALDFVQDVHVKSDDTIDEGLSFYQHPRQAEMRKEVEAFESMHSDLVEHYLGQFVAVHHGQVIDSDHDQIVLADRIYKNYPDEIVLIEQVQEHLSPPLKIRWRQLI